MHRAAAAKCKPREEAAAKPWTGQDGAPLMGGRPQSRLEQRQEEDKAQPQSPATELTEFRGAAKRRTRGGQGPATEPSHRVDRVQGRGQEEDKAWTQSPATELTEFRWQVLS